MFKELQDLSDSLAESIDTSNYGQCKLARKVLQQIKIESQKLRFQITESYKKSKGTPKVKKEKIAVKEPTEVETEEPKLVKEEDDDFFAKK